MSDEFVISPTVADKVREAVLHLGVSVWNDVSCEIMDDFSFLLISISVKDGTSRGQIEQSCLAASAVVRKLVPPKKDDYSWMIVMKVNGEVVESQTSEIL